MKSMMAVTGFAVIAAVVSPIDHAATVRICPLIGQWTQERMNQVAMSHMKFDNIKFGFLCSYGSICEKFYKFFYFPKYYSSWQCLPN